MSGAIPVLYADSSAFAGGAARSLLDLLAALDRGRFRPLLAAACREVLERAGRAGLEVFNVKFPPPARSLLPWRALPALAGLLAARRELRGIAARSGAALVHANGTWAHLAAGDLLGRPSVWHVRDMVELSPLVGRLSDTAAAAVATSGAVAEHLVGQGVPREAVRTIPNGVAAIGVPPAAGRAELRAELRGEWQVPGDAPLVAWVGEFAGWKHPEDFLAALAELRRELPGARGIVLGAARAAAHRGREGELAAAAGELGVAGSVGFLGWREDVPRCLAAADLLISTSEDEPFGRALVEAMAAGVPVVARAGGGVAEVLGDETGLLLDEPAAADYARAAREVLGDRQRGARMGAAGRARARARFSPAAAAARVAALYEELVSGR